jgi:hypothetical protein
VDGNSSVPEQVRRNGTEERPEWGASPEKPSEPLRFETRSVVLPLGVRAEFLAGPPDSQFTFEPLGVLSRFFVRAMRERWQFVCACVEVAGGTF